MSGDELAGLRAWLPDAPLDFGTDRTPRKVPCHQCGGDLTLSFLALRGKPCVCVECDPPECGD